MPNGCPRPVAGFTLAEVLISLSVVGMAVVIVLAVLPAGMKSARLARYQIFAGSLSMTMTNAIYSYSNDYVQPPWSTNKLEDILLQTTPDPSAWLGGPVGTWKNPSAGTTYCQMLRIGEVPRHVVARLDSMRESGGTEELQRICVAGNTPLYYFYYGNTLDSPDSPLRQLVFTVDAPSASVGSDAAAHAPSFRRLIFYAVNWQVYADANTPDYHDAHLDPAANGYPVILGTHPIPVAAAAPPRMQAQPVARFMFYDSNAH